MPCIWRRDRAEKRLRKENERPFARSLVPLLSAMKDFETELMQRMIPADRAIMLGSDARAAVVLSPINQHPDDLFESIQRHSARAPSCDGPLATACGASR